MLQTLAGVLQGNSEVKINSGIEIQIVAKNRSQWIASHYNKGGI